MTRSCLAIAWGLLALAAVAAPRARASLPTQAICVESVCVDLVQDGRAMLERYVATGLGSDGVLLVLYLEDGSEIHLRIGSENDATPCIAAPPSAPPGDGHALRGRVCLVRRDGAGVVVVDYRVASPDKDASDLLRALAPTLWLTQPGLASDLVPIE